MLRKADHDVALAVARWAPESFEHLPEFWRQDPEIVRVAISRNGCALRFAAARFRDDRKWVWAALKSCGDALEFLGPDFRSDRALVLEAVRQNGGALRFAERFRGDREVVLAAVHQESNATRHADPRLLQDDGFLLEAVQASNGWAVYWFPEEKLGIDRALLHSAIALAAQTTTTVHSFQGNGGFYSFRHDKGVVVAAVTANPTVFSIVAPEFRGIATSCSLR